MNNLYLAQALKHVKNPNILVNMVSQRVRQLGQGHKPLVAPENGMSFMSIALKEIADGKISYEMGPVSVLGGTEGAKTRKKK
ncbi:MAG: DNA-directed RNA polymerase subunit omega [Verrucomicrobia bacterium]|nr:DNA-directed RNA polymerase subunit omega [Verrucomicrobiota bacterium]